VNKVAVLPPARATLLALPLMAGPAGFVEEPEESAGWSEMRVVAGVQFEAPKQVSRTNIWL
jgi:hypothetical protein